MAKTLLVTNDFPPTVGGIQSYLRDFVAQLPPEEIVVFASTQHTQSAREYDAGLPYVVERWPRRVMLPTVAASIRMQQLIRAHGIDTVWFGAAAPLGLLGAAAKRAGVRRVVATTHGHEVGWAMLPGSRSVLRRIGRHADVVTYISAYTRRRIERAFGDVEWLHLPSGVDAQVFEPLEVGGDRYVAVRERWGIVERPMVCCISRLVPRKGQDSLIRSWPLVRAEIPDAVLMIVGGGRYERTLRRLAGDGVYFTGMLADAPRTALLAAADVFAMPARTRGGGLDVEGLGIVYLEAQACQVPVIAGDSGGAPETVTAETGVVVSGRDITGLAREIVSLLRDGERRAAMGRAGRAHVVRDWSWERLGARLRVALECPPK